MFQITNPDLSIYYPVLSQKGIEIKLYTKRVKSKYLTIIACHIININRFNILKQNIEYIKSCNTDIILVYSQNLPLNDVIKKEFDFPCFEVPNDHLKDFSKWHHVIKNTDFSNYDFVSFTNDSFSIHHSISHFYNLAAEKKVELYAYTSSSEIKYHYQSYLFILKVDQGKLEKFNSFLEDNIINNQISPQINAVNLEVDLINVFSNKECFLDLGNIPANFKKNIFFHNRTLYELLFKNNFLPFIKLKKTHPLTHSFFSPRRFFT